MSVVDSPELFARIIERLLGNVFICAHSDEEAYKYLEVSSFAKAVDDYVRRMGRTLVNTRDRQAYYLAFIDVDTSERRAVIKQQFREVINQLEPLVRLLELVQSARHDDLPITPGALLRQGELLSRIENTPALKEDIALLVRGDFFKSSKTATRDQLSHVLDRLCTHGYLRRNTATGSDYTALGRWSYLYEVMEFIATHENLDDPSTEPQQENLL